MIWVDSASPFAKYLPTSLSKLEMSSLVVALSTAPPLLEEPLMGTLKHRIPVIKRNLDYCGKENQPGHCPSQVCQLSLSPC